MAKDSVEETGGESVALSNSSLHRHLHSVSDDGNEGPRSFVKATKRVNERDVHSVSVEGLPNSTPLHCVESLPEIDEGDVEGEAIFGGLLGKLTEGVDVVESAVRPPKARL